MGIYAPGPGAVILLTHTGAPTSADGSFSYGDSAMDTNNVFYVCTASGKPGTWVEVTASGSGGVTSFNGGTGAISQSNGYGMTGANSNPPTPAVALTSASSYITSDVPISATTVTNITSLALAAGTWLVLAPVSFQNTGATGEVDFAVGTANNSMTTGVIATALDIGLPAGGSSLVAIGLAVPSTTTTYYLNCEAGQAGTVRSQGNYASAFKATGLVALRLT